MQVPKAKSGFGIKNILGLVFVIIGILLILSMGNFNLPIDLSSFSVILQYAAAFGSVMGGLSMLFNKKEVTPELNIK